MSILSHNDVHEGNCLFDKTRRGKKLPSDMRLIDFEYASYNFRSFDHANHFCEWMFNYENNEAPYYSYNPTNWPTDNQILFYLKHYCKEMEIPLDKTQMLLGRGHQILWRQQRYDVISSLIIPLTEIKQFALVSHIYWFLWSLVQEKVSLIRFDYKVSLARDQWTCRIVRQLIIISVICIRSSSSISRPEGQNWKWSSKELKLVHL